MDSFFGKPRFAGSVEHRLELCTIEVVSEHVLRAMRQRPLMTIGESIKLCSAIWLEVLRG